jgi:hypothetical protein
MPVIIPRLADLEQAVYHALPSVLARAVSAASAPSPLNRRLHCADCSAERREDAWCNLCLPVRIACRLTLVTING